LKKDSLQICEISSQLAIIAHLKMFHLNSLWFYRRIYQGFRLKWSFYQWRLRSLGLWRRFRALIGCFLWKK